MSIVFRRDHLTAFQVNVVLVFRIYCEYYCLIIRFIFRKERYMSRITVWLILKLLNAEKTFFKCLSVYPHHYTLFLSHNTIQLVNKHKIEAEMSSGKENRNGTTLFQNFQTM